jgi:hypothetical protein
MLRDYRAWSAFTIENYRALRDLVRERRKGSGVTQDSIADEAGLDRHNFSRWLSDSTRSEREAEMYYFKVLLWCYNEGWLERNDRSWFMEFASFMGGRRRGPEETRADVEGPYVVYRYSCLAQGSILRGSLDITYEDGIFSTAEVYRIRFRKERGDEFRRCGALVPRAGRSSPRLSWLMFRRSPAAHCTDLRHHTLTAPQIPTFRPTVMSLMAAASQRRSHN